VVKDYSVTKKYKARFKELKDEFSSFRGTYKAIADVMAPYKGRYLTTDTERANDGKRKDQHIINGIAKIARRTLAAGMQGGMTSQSRPWFVLSLPDKSLADYGPVKIWLHVVRDLMLDVFQRSNFYGATYAIYDEIGTFGTASMLVEEDFSTVIRCRPFTIGEYMIALDERYRPDTLFRQYSLSARQLEATFGKANLSEKVTRALDSSKGRDSRFDVIHAIQPNNEFDKTKADARGKKFESVYFEQSCGDGAEEDKLLRKSGYEDIPFVAPRWEVIGVDSYGIGCGHDAVGDNNMLQKLEEKKLKQLDKHTDPAMNAPTSMKNSGGGTIVSGGVNYIDPMQGSQSFVPTYQTNPNIQPVAVEIENVIQRLQKFFYNDLFLAILGSDKNMTATEIAQRHEEKLMMLGPVIERLESEMLNVVIERTFNIMQRFGLIPPPPPELEGMDIKIQYISLLAQAQKMVGTTGIEQVASFTGNLAALYPEVRHKFNPFQAMDEYSDMVGLPPSIIRSTEEAQELMNQERQQAQMQLQAEQGMQAVNAAKALSETEVGNNSALDVLTAGM